MSNSLTLIDIIYDLKPLFKSMSLVKSGLFISDVVDHLPIFHLSDFYIDINPNTVKSRYIFKTYKINVNSVSKLSDVLSTTQWMI